MNFDGYFYVFYNFGCTVIRYCYNVNNAAVQFFLYRMIEYVTVEVFALS